MSRIKTYAINVEKNVYRKEQILAQQEKSGLQINIFKAITPVDIAAQPEVYNSKKTMRFTGRDLFDTEIACCLSHLRLWDALINDAENDFYIILEDDVIFTDNIAEILQGIDLSTIDFLKFTGQHKRPNKHIRTIDAKHCLHKFAYGPLDAGAYLVSKKAAAKLYDYCKEMHSPIDILMDRTYSHGVDIYCVQPYPAHTTWCVDENNPLYTDIGPRAFKYDPNIGALTKLCVKVQRLAGSVMKRMAARKLACVESDDTHCVAHTDPRT